MELVRNLRSIFVVAVITVALPYSLGDNTTLDFSLSSEAANEGESLVATCDVKFNDPSFIIWVKKTVEDNQLVEIATNNHVNLDFTNTHRYTAQYILDIPGNYSRVKFMLNISNLQSQDSGLLTCKLGSMEPENFKPIEVEVPVQKIWWTSSSDNALYSDGQTIFLKESEHQRFVCHVNGSYPQAKVRVFLGDQDITHLFDETSVLKRGDGPKGLQPLYYRTDLKSVSTIVGYRNMTQDLRCVATLPASGSTKVAGVRVNLTEYSPTFLCEEKVLAKLHEQYFNISCKVRANPGVSDVKFKWKSGDGKSDTVEEGDSNHEISANVTKGDDKDEVVMTLTILRVADTHFLRQYIFEAENDISRVEHTIKLERDYTPTYNPQGSSVGSNLLAQTSVLLLAIAHVISVV